MRTHLRAPIGVAAAALVLGACNAIFGIDPGTPLGSTGGTGGMGGSTTTTTHATTTTTTTTMTTTTTTTTTTGTGGQDGGAPCTTSTCSGTLLTLCVNGHAEQPITCDVEAACDAAQGMCVLKSTLHRLALSYTRGCAIEDDKSVRCWGDNSYSNLFLGDPHDIEPSAMNITGSAGARQLSVADDHACYVLDTGNVVCWGANDGGQLGFMAGGDLQPPMQVPGLAGVVEVATRDDCSCARLNDGTVECWGLQDDGCLGTASQVTGPEPSPTALPGVGVAVQLAMGSDDTPSCAREANGDVVCWNSSIVPTQVMGVVGAIDVAVGNGLVFIRTATAVYWSVAKQDSSGWTGATPYVVPAGLLAMAAGDGFCGLASNGKVSCTTLNGGQQPPATALLPGQPPGTVQEIAAGAGQSYQTGLQCLRLGATPTTTIAGNVWCWGDDGHGALGAGAPDLYPNFATPTISDVSWLSATQWSTTAVAGGSVQSWGAAQGLGSQSAAPMGPTSLLGTNNVRAEVMDVAGTAYLIKTAAPPLYLIEGLSKLNGALLASTFTDFVDLRPGADFDVGLRAGGTIVLYAQDSNANMEGVFGDGTTTAMTGEIQTVPTITNATAIAWYTDFYNASPAHICAILGAAGAVSCWGGNDTGEIGIGGMPDDGVTVDTPTAVGGLPASDPVVSIAAGAYFTCAVTTAGRLFCWGDNQVGQLGSTPGDPSPVPVEVTTLGGKALGVTATEDFACAWLADGTARCWGNNDRGQLGSGDFNAVSQPVAVKGLQNVMSVSAGTTHACAILNDKSVACWGSSYNGQVGADLTGIFTQPLQVKGL